MKEHNDILWRDFFKRVHLSPRSPVLRSGQFSHRFHHVIPLLSPGGSGQRILVVSQCHLPDPPSFKGS